MDIILLLSVAAALIAALIQYGLYKITKDRDIMFLIPIILAIPTVFILVRYGNVSIFAKEAGYALAAMFFGVPAVIGSLCVGIYIKKSKKYRSYLMNLMEIKNPCRCGKNHENVTETIIIQKNISQNLIDFIKSYFGNNSKGCIICDINTYNAAKNMIYSLDGLCKAIKLDIGSCHADEYMIKMCDDIVKNISCDYYIACGSGTIHDITRVIAHKYNKPFISYPTAASVDGFVSDIAPVTTKNGMKITLPAVAPVALFADISVIAIAPKRLTASGAGDILGKYIALADWRIANLLTGEYICGDIIKYEYEAVNKVKDSLLELAGDAQTPVGVADTPLPPSTSLTPPSEREAKGAYEKFCADLLEALVISGLCMQYIGNSRPASGAEHHIAHFFEMGIILDSDYLHGENVGIGSVLCADLYHRFANSEKIKFTGNYDIDNALIKEYYKDMYDEIIKENAPNSVKNITPEIFYNNSDKIKNIIFDIPSKEEFIQLLNIIDGVTDIKCDKKLVFKLAPYIRDRLTLLKLMRCIEF
jgi:glycerol-1-phosphate dehydrogenase [NAD(P)+]